ncbi:MAG: hypothetical protein ACPLRZ_07835 [Thermovenabulum sp.]|uniref:hypothetical protein n=1 Tax=Thermovenabulum sp. TaxID=3100335 RepID=UPI003C7A8809
MERTLEQRIEELEKRVAELERQAPEQPKNYEVKLTLDANEMAEKLAEALQKNFDIPLERPNLLKPKTIA